MDELTKSLIGNTIKTSKGEIKLQEGKIVYYDVDFAIRRIYDLHLRSTNQRPILNLSEEISEEQARNLYSNAITCFNFSLYNSITVDKQRILSKILKVAHETKTNIGFESIFLTSLVSNNTENKFENEFFFNSFFKLGNLKNLGGGFKDSYFIDIEKSNLIIFDDEIANVIEDSMGRAFPFSNFRENSNSARKVDNSEKNSIVCLGAAAIAGGVTYYLTRDANISSAVASGTLISCSIYTGADDTIGKKIDENKEDNSGNKDSTETNTTINNTDNNTTGNQNDTSPQIDNNQTNNNNPNPNKDNIVEENEEDEKKKEKEDNNDDDDNDDDDKNKKKPLETNSNISGCIIDPNKIWLFKDPYSNISKQSFETIVPTGIGLQSLKLNDTSSGFSILKFPQHELLNFGLVNEKKLSFFNSFENYKKEIIENQKNNLYKNKEVIVTIQKIPSPEDIFVQKNKISKLETQIKKS